MGKHRFWLTALTLIGAFLGGVGLPAMAVTITVTTTADEVNTNGQCSLREAIINANNDDQSGSTDCAAGSGADTIVLAAGQTYTLSKDTDGGGHATDSGADNDDLDITSAITIQGNGATIERSTTVPCNLNGTAATGEFRIFEVTSSGTLTLQNVTVRNGCADGTFPHFFGGGIFNTGGIVTVTNSTISGNRAIEDGGGIWNDGGTVTVTNSTISSNSAGGSGGIWNDGGTVTITNSTIWGNSTDNDVGGGIVNDGGTMTVTNSTISGNSALAGGGIVNGGPMTVTNITNSTISGNSAVFDGGGILNVGDAPMTITNSTISGNSAANTGSGIFNQGTVNIKNSIVANNTLQPNCFGSSGITPSGTNLTTDTSCPGFTQVTSAQLNLGSLQVNVPGTTATHALLSGSVAIDAAPDCTLVDGTTPVTEDQRGVARPQGAACDVGAYEAVVVTLTIAGAGTGSGTVTGTGISCTISIGSTSGDCSESALPGANPTVTLSAAADSGSTFAGWSGHADCADGVVTINSNKVCVAQFTVVPQRTLTVAGAGTGSGTVAATGISCTITAGSTSGDCAESYAHGTSVTLTATPNSGSTFTGWSGCDSVSGMDCQVTLTAARLVTAQFTDPSLGCPNVLVEARPTTARFIPNSRRAYTRSFFLTVRNNSGGPVTVSDITLRPGTFDGTYTLVRISPTLPQTVLHGRSRTFTVAVRKAANTSAQTVTAPYFDVQMGCGVLPAGARLVPLRVEGLRAQIQAGQVRLEAVGEGIASLGVELFDLSGRRLLTQQGEGRELTVAVDGLANGVYLYVVRVRGFDGREYASAVRKIVILR
jgi:CSLREA domain-containing protein